MCPKVPMPDFPPADDRAFRALRIAPPEEGAEEAPRPLTPGTAPDLAVIDA